MQKGGRYLAGLVLTGISGLTLAGTILWMIPKGYMDFPCLDMQRGECLAWDGQETAGAGSSAALERARMFLCISVYHRAYRGGGTIAIGPEYSDTWSGRGIELTRRDEALVVQGETLGVGEAYSKLRVFPGLSPWFLPVTRTTIANRGLVNCVRNREGQQYSVDALYVFGSVSEGWFPNPLGLILLAVGVAQLVRGRRVRRRQRVEDGPAKDSTARPD
jgi:hypothetical protein